MSVRVCCGSAAAHPRFPMGAPESDTEDGGKWLHLHVPCDLDLTLDHSEPFSPRAEQALWAGDRPVMLSKMPHEKGQLWTQEVNKCQ